jgi:peptidoglycan/LPS O-acetylase OafA/YrhL
MTTSKTPNELPTPPPPPSRQHRKKRLDIQGLRTLAIMGVVAHHISLDGEMQYFMNGGLGVDM